MIGCAYHCRACNVCFGSLNAFDTHRQFEEGHDGDWDHRVCVHPLDDERFASKGEGRCKLALPPKPATTVWALSRDIRRWAERGSVGFGR